MEGCDFIEELKTLIMSFDYFLRKNKLSCVARMMEEFDDSNDVNEIYSILVITQYHKNHELIKDQYARLKEISNRKLNEGKGQNNR